MGEQKQPKEHCDHEVVCRHHFPSDYAAGIPCKDKCAYDTRSRPHPAPAQGCPQWKNNQCNFDGTDCPSVGCKKARQAREDVLKEAITLLEKIKEKFGQSEMAPGASTKLSQRFGAARLGVESSIKAVESMRGDRT